VFSLTYELNLYVLIRRDLFFKTAECLYGVGHILPYVITLCAGEKHSYFEDIHMNQIRLTVSTEYAN
jgi:hypothetical protein